MTYFTCCPSFPKVGSTIGEEAAAHAAVSQRHDDEVLHAMGRTIDVLTDGCHVGIVAQGYSQS